MLLLAARAWPSDCQKRPRAAPRRNAAAALREVQVYLRRLPGGRPDTLDTYGSDLFLACACAHGDPAGLAHLERAYLARIPQYVARIGFPVDRVEELRQNLRIKLLVGDEARIRAYSGRGALGAWLRVLAVRLALDELRGLDVDMDGDPGALERLVADSDGPEIGAIRGQLQLPFTKAFEATLAELSPRDKTLLRMHFLDGLNVDAIGTIFHVHRATAARWLVLIRRSVLEGIRRRLGLDIRPTSSGIRSVVTALRYDFDVSIERVLGTDDDMTGQRPG